MGLSRLAKFLIRGGAFSCVLGSLWKPAVAQIFADIPCTTIENNFQIVGTGTVLVNVPAPADFTVPQQSLTVPTNLLTPGNTFTIDIPASHPPIPPGLTVAFSENTVNLPPGIASGNASAIASVGSTQTILTKTFNVVGAPGNAVANVTVSQAISAPFTPITFPPFAFAIAFPTVLGTVSVEIPTTPNGHIFEVPPYQFTQPSPRFIFVRYAIRRFGAGAVRVRVSTQPNPYVSFTVTSPFQGNFGGNLGGPILVLEPSPPPGTNVVVPVTIEAEAASC